MNLPKFGSQVASAERLKALDLSFSTSADGDLINQFGEGRVGFCCSEFISKQTSPYYLQKLSNSFTNMGKCIQFGVIKATTSNHYSVAAKNNTAQWLRSGQG